MVASNGTCVFLIDYWFAMFQEVEGVKEPPHPEIWVTRWFYAPGDPGKALCVGNY